MIRLRMQSASVVESGLALILPIIKKIFSQVFFPHEKDEDQQRDDPGKGLHIPGPGIGTEAVNYVAEDRN